MRAAARLAVGLCLVLAGCGLGEGAEVGGGAELRVTRDFGREELAANRIEELREDQTVMRMLQAEHDVETRFGGRFVQSIDGLAGSRAAGGRDWFYYVNGVEADRGAGDWELSPGDVVQWDNRAWGAAQRITAIVGAFPEPFRTGIEGRRVPVRLECADDRARACGDARDSLTRAGARVSTTQLGAAGGEELLRVLVGKWRDLRSVNTAATLAEEPSTSGVFARFADDGERLELLDDRGEVVREAEPGTGLVAATAYEHRAVVWLVTGVEDGGVEAAAAALEEGALRNAFAVAATLDGTVKLPLAPTEGGG